jgi:hypothetical protein
MRIRLQNRPVHFADAFHTAPMILAMHADAMTADAASMLGDHVSRLQDELQTACLREDS